MTELSLVMNKQREDADIDAAGINISCSNPGS